MAETIEISTDSYAYNEWNVKNSQWYIAFNTSDALYTVKLYIEVEEREFPTPYGHKTLAQIDAEKSFIKERTGSKQTFTFTAAELHLTHQDDGKMSIEGVISSDQTIFSLSAIGEGTPLALTKGKYTIETSDATLLSLDYAHPGYSSIFRGLDSISGDSLVLALVSDENAYLPQVEGDYESWDEISAQSGTISPKFSYIRHADGTISNFYHGIATVEHEETNYSVSADLLFDNNCRYDITIAYTPEPGDTIDIVCTNTEWTDFSQELGGIWAQASNEVFSNILCEIGYVMAFEPMEINKDYFKCDMWYPGASMKHPSVSIQTFIWGRLELQEGQMVLLSEFIGTDNNYYRIDMRYNKPEPKQTVQLEIPNAKFYNALDAGYFDLNGYTADSTYWVGLMIMSHEVCDTFTLENKGVQKDYSTIWRDNGTPDGDEQAFQWAEVIVTMDKDSAITVSAQLLTKDTILYEVKMYCQFDRPRLTYDCEDSGIEHTFDTKCRNSLSYYTPSGTDAFYLELRAIDDKSKLICQLGFWTETLDEESYLPAGTYPINRTYQTGTMQASNGVTMSGVNSSFIGGYEYDPQEGDMIALPVWFLDRGEATVRFEDGVLSIEVDGWNSYDQQVKIHWSDTLGTDLQNTQTNVPVLKKLQNGVLLIERNGQTYTIKGEIYNKKTDTK